MWMLLATVCTTAQADSCGTLVWTKETFLTEKQCAETGVIQIPALEKLYTFVNPRCVAVPGQSGA
jgi:hypothetical protein